MSLNQVRVKAGVRGKSGRRERFIAVHKKSNKMPCPELCKGHHWYDKLSFNGRRKLKFHFLAFVAPLELGGRHYSVSQREACLTNFVLQNKASHGQTQLVNSIVNMRGPPESKTAGTALAGMWWVSPRTAWQGASTDLPGPGTPPTPHPPRASHMHQCPGIDSK